MCIQLYFAAPYNLSLTEAYASYLNTNFQSLIDGGLVVTDDPSSNPAVAYVQVFINKSCMKIAKK